MSNIVDYIKWRGDIPISADGFNDVDNLILAQMTMIDFKGIVPPPFESGRITVTDAAELFFSDEKRLECPLGILIPPETLELLRLSAASARFGGMKLSGYVTYTNIEEETQFAALTYDIGDGSRYISFRGTDDTIVGWKEDFNLSFLSPIPAQNEAKKYLDSMANEFSGELRVGGHSKGGNLAVYAAVKAEAETKARIIGVYNNDGPGFDREFLSSPDYNEIAEKINTIVPESSVVGMFFENKGDYHIVKSTMTGLLQHNPFSWELLGKEFILVDSLAEDGKRISKALNDWMARLDMDERKKFVDAVYSILIATEATTVTELYEDRYAIVRALIDTDKETKSMIFGIFGLLAEEGGKMFASNIFNLFAKRLKSDKNRELDEGERKELEAAIADAQSAFKELGDGELPPVKPQNKKAEKKDAKREPAAAGCDAERAVYLERRSRAEHRPVKRRKRPDLMTRLAVKTRYAVINRRK